jgi:DNA invertase Pin-like site-specific DNA recombinase
MDIKTAVYCRNSNIRGKQKADSQEHEIRRYCAARGWTDLEIYVDKASGGKTSRPGLDRLVKNMREGKIARVVVHRLDRCGRSLTHFCNLIDEMNRLGVPLVCTSEGIDTSSDNPSAKAQWDVLSAVCRFERILIRERVNSGLASARKNGVRLGRPPTLQRRRGDVLELRGRGKGIREISRQLRMPVSSVFKLLKSGR